MKDDTTVFIVNPNSRGGKTGKNWDKLYSKLKELIDHQTKYIIVDGIGTGLTTTIDVIKSGDYQKIIAVGGEGTINEVVNGIYQMNSDIPLGMIWGGTVNDYLQVINWPRDLEKQAEVINRGEMRSTPLVRATGDQSRVALNMADIGVSAIISHLASVERELQWIRSGFRYTLLALKAIKRWRNIPCTITLDDREITGDLSLFMSGFSTQIGEYRSIPHAKQFGDKMGYTFAMNFSKLQMLRFMGKLHKGTHSEEKDEGVYMGYSSKAIIEMETPAILEVDGEPFSYDATKIEIQSLPEAINVLNPNIG